MKIVSIRTLAGLEIVGRIQMDYIPVKTPDGWCVPGPNFEKDKTDILGIEAFILENPIEVFRVPVGTKDKGPQLMPLITQLLGTSDTEDEIVVFMSDIFVMQETHPEFADHYIKSTSNLDLSAVPKPGIVIAKG